MEAAFLILCFLAADFRQTTETLDEGTANFFEMVLEDLHAIFSIVAFVINTNKNGEGDRGA
jgi:hypothetical protein